MEQQEAPPQPDVDDIRKMRLSIRCQHCIDHSEPANLVAELQQLNADKEVLLVLLDDIGVSEQFSVDLCGMMEIVSGNLERLEIRIADLNIRIASIREHFTSRIRNSFMPHLLRARLLEANSVQTALLLNWIRVNWGWQQTPLNSMSRRVLLKILILFRFVNTGQ